MGAPALVVPATVLLTCSAVVSRVGAFRGNLLLMLGRRRRTGERSRAGSDGVSVSGVGSNSVLVHADRVERVLPRTGVMTKHHRGGRGFLRGRVARRALSRITGLIVSLLGRTLTGPWRSRIGLGARRGRYARPLDRVFRWLGAQEIKRGITTRGRCRRNPGSQHESCSQERNQTSSHVPSPLWRRWSVTRSPVGRRPVLRLRHSHRSVAHEQIGPSAANSTTLTFWHDGDSAARKRPAVCRPFDGGASRTRTGDLLGAIQALSQLSYSPGRAIV